MLDVLAYSVEDAAKVAALSRSKLYEALAEGRLRGVKDGRRTLIQRVDLEAYLTSLRPFLEAKTKVAANG
jgi:excisionase family DNA binding protein